MSPLPPLPPAGDWATGGDRIQDAEVIGGPVTHRVEFRTMISDQAELATIDTYRRRRQWFAVTEQAMRRADAVRRLDASLRLLDAALRRSSLEGSA